MARSLATAALGAAVLAIPATALAADIPGNASTRATLTVQSRTGTVGVFETATDSDWYKVRLVRGTDYAVRADTSIGAGMDSSITARDPRQRPIRTVPGDGLSDVGFELRATTTGTHFIEVKAQNPDDPPPLGYRVAVTPDCRDAASTKCSLEIGRPREGTSVWFADRDRFAVTLDRARRYTFTVTAEFQGLGVDVELLDGRGAVLQDVFDTGEASIGPFRPLASGRHFLRVNVNSDDLGGRYRVLVTAR